MLIPKQNTHLHFFGKNRIYAKIPRLLTAVFSVILLLKSKLFVELIYTAAGVYQLLLARIKRVTLGADLYLDIFLSASRFNDLTASASDSRLLVLRMDSFFHLVHLFLIHHAEDILTQASAKCNTFLFPDTYINRLTASQEKQNGFLDLFPRYFLERHFVRRYLPGI